MDKVTSIENTTKYSQMLSIIRNLRKQKVSTDIYTVMYVEIEKNTFQGGYEKARSCESIKIEIEKKYLKEFGRSREVEKVSRQKQRKIVFKKFVRRRKVEKVSRQNQRKIECKDGG